ncbi:MAG: hypothetical protein KDB48_10355 [Solirubrobacterales bacterium]|nr:hypothetical protein [Solirubrobacterales bacterium]HMT03954.1 thiamine pyrophosphate-dependent enzyme [Solirubrobacterales bacterium]
MSGTAATENLPVGIDERRELFTKMVESRLFEEEAERQYKAAKIGGYCHLSSGQEAATVGSVAALEDDDYLVTGYRCHGFALARGIPPGEVMAELFGRQDGCAHGRGGSMHLLDVKRRFYGGWGIVAGQLPIATGLALGLVRQSEPQAVLCELGEGAVNMGAWHESLNLAAVWNLPVVFLVINNIYGMGTSVDRASAEPEVFRRAAAYRMTGERVDGNDVDEVLEASHRLLAEAREERRPAVLEALTYRHRGHSVADAGLAYRSREEVTHWREESDPIRRQREILLEAGISENDLRAVEEAARKTTLEAVAFADSSPEPPVDRLATGMYAPGSAGQFERMRPGSAFGEEALTFDAGLGQ